MTDTPVTRSDEHWPRAPDLFGVVGCFDKKGRLIGAFVTIVDAFIADRWPSIRPCRMTSDKWGQFGPSLSTFGAVAVHVVIGQ